MKPSVLLGIQYVGWTKIWIKAFGKDHNEADLTDAHKELHTHTILI